jgi:hypothetical protein
MHVRDKVIGARNPEPGERPCLGVDGIPGLPCSGMVQLDCCPGNKLKTSDGADLVSMAAEADPQGSGKQLGTRTKAADESLATSVFTVVVSFQGTWQKRASRSDRRWITMKPLRALKRVSLRLGLPFAGAVCEEDHAGDFRKQKSGAPAGMLRASQAQSSHGLFEHGVVACHGICRRNRDRDIRCQSNFFKQGFLCGVLYPARYRELPPVGEFERTRVSRPLAEELCYTIFSPVRDVKPPIPGGHSC